MINRLQEMIQWIIRLVGIVVCVTTVLACAAVKQTHRTQQIAPLLWHRGEFSGLLPRSAETVRMILVAIDIPKLFSAENRQFLLELPDGRSLTVDKAGQKLVGARGFFWHGKLEKDPGSFVTFSVVNDSVMGSIITSKGEFYRLRNGPGGLHFIEKVDPAKIPYPSRHHEEPGRMGQRNEAQPRASLVCNDGRQVDVLVLYTKEAKEGACQDAGIPLSDCGPEEIENTVTMGVGETISSYFNSDINQDINLLPITEVNYDESTYAHFEDDVKALRGDPNYTAIEDTNGTTVSKLRDQEHYAADLVVLIEETDKGTAGYATQMQEDPDSHRVIGNTDKAFAVVLRKWATSTNLGYDIPHELGHMMGAHHDWDSGSFDDYTYNHGYYNPTPSDPEVAPWRTIMTYSHNICNPSCVRLPIWSNPTLKYPPLVGDYTGIGSGAKLTDNAKRLREDSTTVVANYYCHVQRPDTNPPIIFNVDSENINFHSAVITWSTNKSATSQVEYGTVIHQYPSSTALDTNLVTSHSIPLSGLIPSTVYHFRVRSADDNGKLSYSGDYSFTTPAVPKPPAPAPPAKLRIQ